MKIQKNKKSKVDVDYAQSYEFILESLLEMFEESKSSDLLCLRIHIGGLHIGRLAYLESRTWVPLI